MNAEDIETIQQGTRAGKRDLRSALICSGLFLLYFCLTAALQYAASATTDDFGGNGDEPSHYVTGLMVHDYIAQRFPGSPVRFAENYYLHYPKVGFGHWPPVFYFMQAFWMLLFSTSRTSLLFMQAALTALTGVLMYRTARPYLSPFSAHLVPVLYILLPLVQSHNGMVMAEVPMTLFCLLALISLARYGDTGRLRDAIWFGLWACTAILTKGNAWALAGVPGLMILLTQKWSRLKTVTFWVPAVLVGLVCIPFTLWSMQMVMDGWDADTLSWAFTSKSLLPFIVFNAGIIGPALTLCLVAGLWAVVIVPLVRKTGVQPWWAVMMAWVVSTILFHAFVPTSVESRKVFMAIPALLFLAGAGMDWFAGRLPFRWRHAVVTVLVVAGFGLFSFSIPREYCNGFVRTVQFLRSRPELNGAIFLISSNEDGEGRFVAELAHQSLRPDHIVLRASKQLARYGWLNAQYQLRYTNEQSVQAQLANSAVSVVILHTVPRERAHHALLTETLRNRPGEWRQIYSLQPHCSRHNPAERIEVFYNQEFRTRRPRAIQIDLENKLNRVLKFEF